MIELEGPLNAEDWRCAGFWRVTDGNWRVFSAADRLDTLVASATPSKPAHDPAALSDPAAAAAPPAAAWPPRYLRARDLAGAVFPVSEAVIL